MVQNNKVLTVSYGTFSCTLEGFDDAFGTMKAIAEYFRDLAADDRYFGAEPPQPDADMLARIAEREIARQVEARRDGDGFVLRAGSASTPAIAKQAPPPAETPASSDAVAPRAAEPEATAEPDTVADPETVADAYAETIAEPETAEEPQPAAEPDAGADSAPPPHPVAETAEPETLAVPEAETAVDDETAEDDSADDLVAEDVTAELVPEADSIAAKLARIRAVVSRNQEAAAAEEYTEDEHADALSRAVPALEDEDDDQDDEDFDAMLERLESGTVAEVADADPAGEDSLFGQLDESLEDEDDEDELSNILGDDRVTDELEDDDEDDDELSAAAKGDGSELDDGNDRDGHEDVDPAGTAEATPERARLVKIKRSRIAAAIEAGELEEIEDDQPEPEPKLPPVGLLSPEDEADLLRELAQVEAEFIGGGAQAREKAAEPAKKAAADSEADRPRGKLSGGLEDGNGDDLERLMAATDRKLDDPEAAARHDAYSRMRGAVAATKAERSAGGTLGSHTSDQTYREDLASVVRPRRPEPGQSRPQRPTSELQSAPLRLVAEQRIDDQAGAAARGPVRPRRITTQLLNEEDEVGTPTPEGGFAEFAAEMGAQELPELLEAAAAYMSFVEGRAQFSRPQLMSKVRQVGNGDINREDSLRSFGQLLREGKIEKRGGGRFSASSEIGFRPDGERAAG